MQSESKRKQDWLWRYQRSRRAEARIRKQILDEMDRATATTKALSPIVVSGGSGSSKIEEAVDVMQERREELCQKLVEAECVRKEIEKAIDDTVPEGLMQDILHERYIVGTPYWWMIANNLHISEKWARENHRKAIDALKI